MEDFKVVDLFCGVGGLSCGLRQAGFKIEAGYDLDNSCKYAYEKNIKSIFICKNIKNITREELNSHFKGSRYKILVGCAPCQTFSKYTKGKNNKDDEKWTLLNEFLRLVLNTNPHVISMENVPNLKNYPIFNNFIEQLERNGYFVSYSIAFCPDYGIPQNRRRLVLLASKLGKISLIDKTHNKNNYVTTRQAIGFLPKIKAGEQNNMDPLHISRRLSELNMKRIKATPKNGGSWKDWPDELILKCHKKESGKNFGSVYGRMNWDQPSPTMTTFCTSIGNGRFGHPEQDRAISLREASLLQTFPHDYDFIENLDLPIKLTSISRHIGNAVPPRLGEIIGISIKKHFKEI